MCGIEFTVEIKAEPPYAFAEQRLLPKLISNLVDNAFAAALKAPPAPEYACCGKNGKRGGESCRCLITGRPSPRSRVERSSSGSYH